MVSARLALLPAGFLTNYSHCLPRASRPLREQGEASVLPEDHPWTVDFILLVQLPQVDDLQHIHQVDECPRNLSKGRSGS